MSAFDAIVIGAGVNGLVAGTMLARRGKSVCILEQSGSTGGMAGLSMEDGPPLAHLAYNLSPRVLRDVGLDPDALPIRLHSVSTVSLAGDGRHIVLRGTDACYADGTEHPEAAAFGSLANRLIRYGDLLRRLAEAPPPGGDPMLSGAGLRQLWRLGRFGLGLRGMGKQEMRAFLQVLLSNASDLILDEISDGPLAGLLAADAVRGASLGPRSPGTVFSLIYRYGHGGDIRLPEGGMRSVTDAITEAAHSSGCLVEMNTSVARILIEDDRVAGVETGDGRSLTAPMVMSSAAPLPTACLAGLANFDIEASRRLRNIRSRGTTAKINLRLSGRPHFNGLSQELIGARLIVAPSADYVETAFNPAKYGEISQDPVIEAILPDPGSERPWLSLIVQYVPSDLRDGWTEVARQKLLEAVLATLGRYAPGLPDLVEDAQVMTPDMIEAATGVPGGHWHHAEMSLDQLLTVRPVNGMARYETGLKGLYLCGAATHPGGDVMGLSGRNAALRALEGSR